MASISEVRGNLKKYRKNQYKRDTKKKIITTIVAIYFFIIWVFVDIDWFLKLAFLCGVPFMIIAYYFECLKEDEDKDLSDIYRTYNKHRRETTETKYMPEINKLQRQKELEINKLINIKRDIQSLENRTNPFMPDMDLYTRGLADLAEVENQKVVERYKNFEEQRSIKLNELYSIKIKLENAIANLENQIAEKQASFNRENGIPNDFTEAVGSIFRGNMSVEDIAREVK